LLRLQGMAPVGKAFVGEERLLLLEDIEKAHTNLVNLPFQITDRGKLTDHNGGREERPKR
jgi:hypothetical protein